MILCKNPKGGTVKIGISLIEKSMIKPEATLVVVAHGSRVSTSNQGPTKCGMIVDGNCLQTEPE